MGHLDMGNAYVAALNAQQWDTVASYLTDDFTWTSSPMGTIGKQAYLASLKPWFAGAPDYRVTWQPQRDEGDTVHGMMRAEGTQTNPLAFPGMPTIPATGKHFSATFPVTVTWHGDKIAAMTLGPSSTPSIFEQLGVQPPA